MTDRDPAIAKLIAEARAKWPRNTISHIAQVAKVSTRSVKYWLAGENQPSGRAVVRLQRELGIID